MTNFLYFQKDRIGSESAISKYENDRRGQGRLRQIALVPPKRKFERSE